MRSRIQQPNFRGLPHVAPPDLHGQLRDALSNAAGGLRIVAAPAYSGKSSNLRVAFNGFIEQGGSGLFFGSDMSDENDVYKKLQLSGGRAELFKFIPRDTQTAFVFDQFEDFDKEATRGFIKFLTTESVHRGNLSVTVSTGRLQTAKELLSLNSGRKAAFVCAPDAFRWGLAEFEKYIAGVNTTALEAGILAQLRDKVLISGNVGFLVDTLRKAPLPSNLDYLTACAAEYGAEWVQFAKLFRDRDV